MSGFEKVGEVAFGNVYRKGDQKYVIVQLDPDQYGDDSFAVGKVAMESDFEPFDDWKAAYAYMEKLS